MNKKIFLAFSALFLAIILVLILLFTYAEFGSLNPIATAMGLIRVCAFDEPYVQTGFLFKAYVGQSDSGLDLLIQRMEDLGYLHLPDKQLGSMHYFISESGIKQRVLFQQNAYFSKWIWY